MSPGREAGPGKIEPEPVPCANADEGCEGMATPPATLCPQCIDDSYPKDKPNPTDPQTLPTDGEAAG